MSNENVVAILNDGYSRIVVDDSCYVIKNGEKYSSWIFKEALDVLKLLPNDPNVALRDKILVVSDEKGIRIEKRGVNV